MPARDCNTNHLKHHYLCSVDSTTSLTATLCDKQPHASPTLLCSGLVNGLPMAERMWIQSRPSPNQDCCNSSVCCFSANPSLVACSEGEQAHDLPGCSTCHNPALMQALRSFSLALKKQEEMAYSPQYYSYLVELRCRENTHIFNYSVVWRAAAG